MKTYTICSNDIVLARVLLTLYFQVFARYLHFSFLHTTFNIFYSICFINTHPVNSDLSGGQRYPAFEQLGPVLERIWVSTKKLAIAALEESNL